MKHRVFWIALIALMVLHHDWWFWNDGTLVFGILPVGLAYHVIISLAAGALWAWAALDVMSDYFLDNPVQDSPSKSDHVM